MSPSPNSTQIRLDNVVVLLTTAVVTLDMLSDACNTPFLVSIVSTVRSMVTLAQSVKQNRKDCTDLLKKIHELLSAIIGLYTDPDFEGDFPPTVLHGLGKFAQTLHKIHVFVEGQQEGGRVKQFFRQVQMNTMLKDSKLGLQQALVDFNTDNSNHLKDLAEMEKYAEEQHQEVLKLLEAFRDTSDNISSIRGVFSSFHSSSNSLSMLPAEPKIFHDNAKTSYPGSWRHGKNKPS
ncbi:hypothetical protein C8R43DRAFT_1239369, partial [Mycena crocata]